MTQTERFFVPVCLYPHTKYRTRAGLDALFEKFALAANPNIIIVADRLLALDRLVTGRYWVPENVYKKARQEAEQVLRLVQRTAKAHGADDTSEIYFWDDVAGRDDYVAFTRSLHGILEANDGMAGHIEAFVTGHIERFGSGANPDRARAAEYEYLMSEVAMSVYCTEQLGFTVEIWERPVPPDNPDPLGVLYADYPDLVTAATGAAPRRGLRYLFDDAD